MKQRWLILAVVLTAACQDRAGKSSRARSEAVASASQEMSGPLLFASDKLLPALQALRSASNGKWLRLEIRAREIVVQAEDPSTTGAVLEYHYRDGKVGEAEPAKVRGKGELGANLFDVADVKLDAIPSLTREAVRRVDPASGSVDWVLVRRDLPDSDEIKVRVYVASPRRSGYLDADRAGQPL